MRQFVIRAAAKAFNSTILDAYNTLTKYEYLPQAELRVIQQNKLQELLRHSYLQIPYYSEIFNSLGISNIREICSDTLASLPILTKEHLRLHCDTLVDTAGQRVRGGYVNSSGGSTGEPVTILQDKHYTAWNIATTQYMKTSFGGQKLGDPEVRLWGALRDLKGQRNLKSWLQNWIYNRTDLNSYKMTQEKLEKYAGSINTIKPSWIEGYAHSLYELAQYTNAHNLKMHSPKGVLTSAGILHPFVRNLLVSTFRCSVYNRYGSREVGGIACECDKMQGMHQMMLNSVIEVVDSQGKHVPAGEPGRVLITTLNNYTMPLIRYDIGDVAAISQNQTCPCGRGWLLIDNIVGRENALLRTRSGEIIDGGLITQHLYHKKWCKQFQVVQETYDYIKIYIVVNAGSTDLYHVEKVEFLQSIRGLLKGIPHVEVVQVNVIEPMQNGKRAYIISKIETPYS